jgi:hypothetical protein
MYAATCALNGMTGVGKKSGDWGVHQLGHCLSVLYDVPHGASLSIVYPAWLKLQKDRIPDRIQELGTALFETSSVDDTIYKLEYIFKVLESPLRLKDYGIEVTPEVKEKIRKTMIHNKANGAAYPLSESDYATIIDLMA